MPVAAQRVVVIVDDLAERADAATSTERYGLLRLDRRPPLNDDVVTDRDHCISPGVQLDRRATRIELDTIADADATTTVNPYSTRNGRRAADVDPAAPPKRYLQHRRAPSLHVCQDMGEDGIVLLFSTMPCEPPRALGIVAPRTIDVNPGSTPTRSATPANIESHVHGKERRHWRSLAGREAWHAGVEEEEVLSMELKVATSELSKALGRSQTFPVPLRRTS